MCKYAVVDLEMCFVPVAFRTKEFHYANETIQIGAVLMNESYEIIDRFDTFVHPEFGVIDSFIEGLTGITKKDVADAPTFAQAFASFLAWLPEDVKLVEWSNSDLLQLKHEMQGKRITVEREELFSTDYWLDCQRMFADKIDCSRQYSLTEAVNVTDIACMDGAHNGYVDAYNTALLFAKLQQTPDSKSFFRNIGIDREPLCSTLGDLFAGLQLQCFA